MTMFDAIIVEYLNAPGYERAFAQYPNKIDAEHPLVLQFHGIVTRAQALQQAETEYLLRRTIVYLREVDAGTNNACWVVCAKEDHGAWAFAPLDFV